MYLETGVGSGVIDSKPYTTYTISCRHLKENTLIGPIYVILYKLFDEVPLGFKLGMS